MSRQQDPVMTASTSAILPIPGGQRRRRTPRSERRIEAPRPRLELPLPAPCADRGRPSPCEESTARGAVVVDFYL